MNEQWMRLEEGNGDYCISNMGRVMNMETGKVLKPRPTKNGYFRVQIREGKTRKDFYIHRLVAKYFCIHSYGNDVVNHIDNDVTNNNADNLEWTTQKGNVHHGMKQGRYSHNAIPVIGIKGGNEYYFASTREAEKETGCYHKSIAKCCKNVFGQTNGYRWRYAEVSL